MAKPDVPAASAADALSASGLVPHSSKTAFLHIGTQKTGSTSIQACLVNAQTQGVLGSVCYPQWEDVRHHNRLNLLYRSHGEMVGTMREEFPSNDRRLRRARERYRRFFFGNLQAAGGAIISAESLCGFSPAQVAHFRADLEAVGYRDFHVVLYVRDPADFYLSRTQQMLRATPRDPTALLSRVHDGAGPDSKIIIDPASFVYDFRRAIETWEMVFPGRVTVRRFQGGREDVVRDFARLLDERMGITLPDITFQLNPTLSAEGMQILEEYRDTFWPGTVLVKPDAVRLVGYLANSSEDIAQTKPVLKEEVAQRIRANHSADARWLLDHYGVDLGLGDVDPQAPAPPSRQYRVGDILQSVDLEIAHELLLRAAGWALQQERPPRPLPLRGLAWVYHRARSARGPRRLGAERDRLRGSLRR